MSFWLDNQIEKVWRFLLFLPKRQDLFDDNFSVMSYKERYHARPRREYVAESIHRFLLYTLPAICPCRLIRSWYKKKVDKFCFFRAREFTYRTHTKVVEPESDIDGYLEYSWGPFKKRRLTFDVMGIDTLIADCSSFATDLNEYGKWGIITLLIPKNKFSKKDAEKALVEWYKDKTCFRYRHFTSQGEEPTFLFDWDSDTNE